MTQTTSRFDSAIVRPPAATFADGLTTVDLGLPDLERALAQHEAYVRALLACGLEVTRLDPEPAYPDSTFVEDTAILWGRRALLTRPGAESRAGEVAAIAPVVAASFAEVESIEFPATLDGGDVCEVDGHFLIGLSARTNEEGARQLAAWAARGGGTSDVVDVRAVPGILHLKSGLSELGDGHVAVIETLAAHPALARYERVVLDPAEAYAANAVRVNDRLLVAAGFPRFESELARLGYDVLPLAMSEFQKMDGGLTCLSLRFQAG